MKTTALLILLAFFVAYAPRARAANVQIRDLTTTTVLPAANDFLIRDGITNGTTKSAAANTVFQTETRTTLAALSVTNVSTGVVVQTQGGATVADQNSALYYYNSTSTATPDGVNVIQPAVGSGRWLILKTSSLPFPAVGTLGGVYSSAAVTYQYITSINTDGTVSRAQPAAGDITGLGSMAIQSASAVAITGGTITGLPSLIVSGTSNTPNLRVQNATTSVDGLIGSLFNSSHFGIGTVSAHDLGFYRNNVLVGLLTNTGLNALAIGQTTPGAGAFTILTATTPVPLTSGGTGSSTAAGARTNLGITATGADTTYAYRANNLSDLASASSARSNLGVTASGADTAYAFRANNLSDLASASTARTNLGLGTMATQNSNSIAVSGGYATGLSNFSSDTDANLRTIKTNLRVAINAKDYGALGDGTTNDSTALANTFAAAQVGASGVGSYVAEIVVVYGGSGYTSAPTVSVSTGSGVTATAVVKDQRVVSVYVTAAGTGYTTATEVSFSGGGGTGASAYPIIGAGAIVTIPPGVYYVPNGVAIGGLHNVTINAQGAAFKRDSTSSQPGFWLQGTCHRVTLDGLQLYGYSSDRNGSYGVGILGHGDDITVRNCHVSKWPNYAIQFHGDTAQSRYFAGPTIINNTLENNYADGIHIGHGFIGPKVINNTVLDTEEEDAIAIYNDFMNNLITRDALVSGNVIRDARWRGILVADVFGATVTGNTIDGTASHGISGDDGATAGSITLTLTNSSTTATSTAGTPFVGAYIYGTGLSLPTIITAVSGATVTLSQAANSSSSQSFSMYHGSMSVNITGNTILNVATLTKNGTGYTDRHGVNIINCAKQNVSNNLCVGLPSAGYAVKLASAVDIYVSSNGGLDQQSGANTFSVGSNVFGTRATYDDSGALKYRGSSGTVTTLGNP